MPIQPVITRALLRQAEEHLSAVDKNMKRLIERYGSLSLRKKEPPFHVLSISIIHQQLSTKAAAAIKLRIDKLVPPPYTLEAMAKIPTEKLRAAGLSERKAQYLGIIATRALSGEFPLTQFRQMEDEEIIESLICLPGVGKWTAEMFLMFALRRPDIVSAGDLVLCRAAANLYSKRYRGDSAEILLKAARKWRPYRTIACLYLWKTSD